MTTNQQAKFKIPYNANSKLSEVLQQQKQQQAQIPKFGQNNSLGKIGSPEDLKELAKKITESSVSKSAKQSTAANVQNNSAGQAQKECSNFCRKTGFNILPLRYTVVSGAAQALPATLGKNVKEIQLSHFKYAVEMIDTGYIYRLVKRASGALEWAGYLVTPKGHLSYFPVGKEAPKSVPEFACKGAGHSVNSSLITLESNPKDEAKVAYLIHTHDPMSKLKLKEYEKNAEKFVTEGKWQKIIVGGGAAQAHCLAAANLKNSIYNAKSFGTGRIDQILKKFAQEPNNVACMALYDPIGITLKLNDSRNARFEKLTKYIAEKDNKTTNEHKLNSSQLIDSIKIVVENKLINQGLSSNTLQADLSTKLIFAQGKIPLFGSMDQRDYQRKVNEIWDQASPQEKEKFLQQYNKKYAAGQKQVRDKIISQSKAQAKLDWETKYSTKIDWTAKNAFDDKVKALTNEARKSAQAYANDHLQWLQSKQLLKAFYTYDQTVLKGDGALFHIKVLSLINGMTGCDQGQALMEKWLGVDKISDDNLYMRAVTYNQKSLIDQYNAKSPEITSLTWDQSQSSLKGLIAAFVSADQLWEQWLADPNNKVNDLKWYNPARALPWISEITRSVAKWSLQYNASPLIAKKLSRVSFIAYAHSSLLTDKVPKWSLLYNIDLKMTNAASQLNATEIQKRWKNAGQNTATQKIKEILSKSSVSVALRISGVVALFELINLGTQASLFAGDRNWENGFKVTAGLLATTAVVLDIAGGGMDALSFQEKANKIRLYGARLAIGGATFSMIADITAFVKEFGGKDNIFLLIVLGAKATISLLMVGVGIGMLLRLPALAGRDIVIRLQKSIAIKSFLTIGIMRAAVWLNWIGIGLSVIEIILRNYYYTEDELQKWCKKSVFGTEAGKYESLESEEEAFSKAVVSV